MSELVMGEVSFLLLALFAITCFIWGISKRTSSTQQIIACSLYCLAIAIALHSRIHIVAVAGGVCLASTMVLGRRSWPWWLASLIAGLLRLPLMYRWGGLVSSEYQSLHGLGFRLESMAYLAAALVPFVGVFAVAAWRHVKSRAYLIVAFLLGYGLCLIAMPDLSIADTIDFVNPNDRYKGIAATIALSVSSHAWVQQVMLGLLAGFGLAGLTGLWICRKPDASTIYNVIHEITFWSLLSGWMLYALTRGFVFDRFLLVWAFLLPIIWIRVLPKWLLAVQYCMLALIAARLTIVWLM